jgi:RNA methyltransferase, TrmH family
MNSTYISSPKNPRLQAAIALRDSKHRKRTGLFLIDGGMLIERAVQHGFAIVEAFIREGAESSDEVRSLLASQPEMESMVVSSPAMQRLQYGDQSHDVIAVARSIDLSLDGMESRQSLAKSIVAETYLVLDRMEKPGNLGAALRTADAVGVRGVVLCDPICDPWNPNTVRSSLGALFTVPIAIASEDFLSAWFRERGIGVYTARVDGDKDYRSVRFPVATALVIGNEAEGLGGRWSSSSYESVFIPMAGSLDSLNASVSTAVLLFEIGRQRNEQATEA